MPDAVTAGRDLEFTVKLRLDSAIEANFTPTVTVYRRNSISKITSIPLTFVTYEKPLNWPVGEPFEVQCRVSIPDYFESGKYTLQMDENMLLLTGDNIYENKFWISRLLQPTPAERMWSPLWRFIMVRRR